VVNNFDISIDIRKVAEEYIRVFESVING